MNLGEKKLKKLKITVDICLDKYYINYNKAIMRGSKSSAA